MSHIPVTVEIDIHVPIETVFAFATDDAVLPRILIGTRFLPRVVKTSGATGAWNLPNSKRIVHLANGATAQEMLTGYRNLEYFDYRVSDYTLAIKYFAEFATGQWWFTKLSDTSTHIKWTYTLKSYSVFANPLVWFFCNVFWRAYMVNGLQALKYQLEETQHYQRAI